jgi:hypothetical protein
MNRAQQNYQSCARQFKVALRRALPDSTLLSLELGSVRRRNRCLKTSAVLLVVFLILGALEPQSSSAQNACQNAWMQYKNCVAGIVNQGGAVATSCVAPTCALGGSSGNQSPAYGGPIIPSGSNPFAGSSAHKIACAAQPEQPFCHQNQAGNNPGTGGSGTEQNTQNAIDAIKRATEGLGEEQESGTGSPQYNPVKDLGRASLEDFDGDVATPTSANDTATSDSGWTNQGCSPGQDPDEIDFNTHTDICYPKPCGNEVPKEVDYNTGSVVCPNQPGQSPNDYWDSENTVASTANDDAAEDIAEDGSSGGGPINGYDDASHRTSGADSSGSLTGDAAGGGSPVSDGGRGTTVGGIDGSATATAGSGIDVAKAWSKYGAPQLCPEGAAGEDCKKGLPVIGSISTDASKDAIGCLKTFDSGSGECNPGSKIGLDMMKRIPWIGDLPRAMQSAQQTYQNLLNKLQQGKSDLTKWWNNIGAGH